VQPIFNYQITVTAHTNQVLQNHIIVSLFTMRLLICPS
jgi:hypothetical protein